MRRVRGHTGSREAERSVPSSEQLGPTCVRGCWRRVQCLDAQAARHVTRDAVEFRTIAFVWNVF